MNHASTFPVFTLLLCLLFPSTALAQDTVEPVAARESDDAARLVLELDPFGALPVCAKDCELQVCVTEFTPYLMNCGNWYQLSLRLNTGDDDAEVLSYRLGDGSCTALLASDQGWLLDHKLGHALRANFEGGKLRLLVYKDSAGSDALEE
ncbi:MAG: hypothetical protein RBU37_01875 [Myxococcota bacterium]|nr:hypothetical protein [Myxococcota bacterium]